MAGWMRHIERISPCTMKPEQSKPTSRSGFGKFAMLLLVLWVAVMVVGLNSPPRSDIEIIAATARKPAYELSYPMLDKSSTWKLSENRGKVVLVNYWATWCGPCQQETPALVGVSKALKSKGLEMVGITMDQGSDEVVHRFIKAFAIPYPIAKGTNDPMLMGGIPLPTTLVYDREGRLATKIVGAVEANVLEKALVQLLDES